jgi:hypothetical protein
MNELSEFFNVLKEQKKIQKEQSDLSIHNRINRFHNLKNEIEIDTSIHLSFDIDLKEDNSEESIDISNIEEINEEFIDENILSIEPEVKNTDPLTPLNQNFVTLEDLNRHYNLFLNRIQQQLSSLGGGGETNLAWMDLPLTTVTTSSYQIKPSDYYIGVNYEGAVTITLPLNMKDGKVFVIKDELGEASRGTNRYITIIPSGNDTIDGQNRAILAYDYGSLTFVYKNNIWRII